MQIEKDADGQAVKISMIKPADMHQHFRDDWRLKIVGPMVARRFAMAVAMPNLSTPITTATGLVVHGKRIYDAAGPKLRALMTLYLTDTIELAEVTKACQHAANFFVGVKYYPGGKPGIELTTGSSKGVSNPSALWTKGSRAFEVLRVLAEHKRALLLHAADGFDAQGEELDPYEQERHFAEQSLPRIREAHPDLKISVEHLSTAWGVEAVKALAQGSDLTGCSVTQHHLTLDRRDVFRSGYNVHRSWMPAIQPREHKEELRRFVSEGHPYVWLGSDSAPHSRKAKETACCASGVFTAHAGIEFYAEAFEDLGALDDRFEQFASVYGPQFFGIKPSDEKLTLVRESWKIERPFYAFVPTGTGVEELVPFRLGDTVRWKLED